MVSPAKGAVPGYLARLAGGASADAPRLQPPRPLFSSVAGAIKDAGPEPAVAGIDGHPGLVQHGSARIRRGPVTASPGTDIAASSVGYQASQRISHTQALDGGAPDPLPAPPVPPMQGAVSPGPSAVPHANSIQANTDSSPALIPAVSAEPVPVPTKSPLPATAAPALRPPKPGSSVPEIEDYSGLRRPTPVTAPITSAQVSIGTIEVTVLPPKPGPIPPKPSPLRARPKAVGVPGQSGSDAARQAARGAARRWFGAGQS